MHIAGSSGTRHGPNRPIDRIPNPIVKLGLLLEERNEQAIFTKIDVAAPTQPTANTTTPQQQSDANVNHRLALLEQRNAKMEGIMTQGFNHSKLEFERLAKRERKNDRMLRRIANSPLARRRRVDTTTADQNDDDDDAAAPMDIDEDPDTIES